MKKVYLFEVLHHHECISLPFESMKESKNISPKLFISSFVNKRLETPYGGDDVFVFNHQQRERWVQAKKGNTFFKKLWTGFAQSWEVFTAQITFLKEVHRARADAIYINTPKSILMLPIHFYILCNRSTKVISVVHDVDLSGFKQWMYLVYRRSDTLVFLAPYIIFLNARLSRIPRLEINNRITPEHFKKDLKEKITFVLPGRYDAETKDYRTFLRGFMNLPEQIKGQAQILFLAKLTKEIQEIILFHGAEKFSKTFDSYVNDKEFISEFSHAHICVLATQGVTYGTHRISGAYGDAIAFNTPIIASSDYTAGKKIPGIVSYDTDSLEELLEKIILNSEYREELQAEIQKNHEAMTTEAVSKKFDLLFSHK